MIYGKKIQIIILAFIFAAPILASADITSPRPGIWPFGYWGGDKGLLSCTGNYGTKIGEDSGGTDKSDNPCTSLEQLEQTFVNFIYFGISLVLFIFAPVLFAWGGIMILISGGSTEKLASGKKILTGTLWGVVITLLAYLIVYEFVRVLGAQSVIGEFK